MQNPEIEKILGTFQKLWDESLNGDYTHQNELRKLAIIIRDMKCKDAFIISDLTPNQQITYQFAISLANCR